MQITVGDFETPFWKAVVAAVEEWVKTTPEGRAWMVSMASDIGAPLQLTLPFDRGANRP